MISATQIHLLLNHFPVLCTLLGIPILLYGWLRKSDTVLHVALGLFVLGALSAVPVYFTGEGAEEAVEHLPGVVESLIERHEDLAKLAMLCVEGLGVLALAALWLVQRQSAMLRWMVPVVLLMSLGTSGVMAQTAHLGGQIRHSEIRSAQGQTGSTEVQKEVSDASETYKSHEQHEIDEQGEHERHED